MLSKREKEFIQNPRRFKNSQVKHLRYRLRRKVERIARELAFMDSHKGSIEHLLKMHNVRSEGSATTLLEVSEAMQGLLLEINRNEVLVLTDKYISIKLPVRGIIRIKFGASRSQIQLQDSRVRMQGVRSC